ncbi:MAG: hypothetical protein PHY02_10845 [Phycisphaerae bacterium]|nr:hypothetical protein [Phycisphaerae bacterium]
MLKDNILIGKIYKEFSGGSWWCFQDMAYLQVQKGNVSISSFCGKTEGEVETKVKQAIDNYLTERDNEKS